MAQQTVAQMMERLGDDGRHLGFLEYLPEAAQSEIAAAVDQTLNKQSSALSEAIDKGTQAMPGWLRPIAKFLLN